MRFIDKDNNIVHATAYGTLRELLSAICVNKPDTDAVLVTMLNGSRIFYNFKIKEFYINFKGVRYKIGKDSWIIYNPSCNLVSSLPSNLFSKYYTPADDLSEDSTSVDNNEIIDLSKRMLITLRVEVEKDPSIIEAISTIIRLKVIKNLDDVKEEIEELLLSQTGRAKVSWTISESDGESGIDNISTILEAN